MAALKIYVDMTSSFVRSFSLSKKADDTDEEGGREEGEMLGQGLCPLLVNNARDIKFAVT